VYLRSTKSIATVGRHCVIRKVGSITHVSNYFHRKDCYNDAERDLLAIAKFLVRLSELVCYRLGALGLEQQALSTGTTVPV